MNVMKKIGEGNTAELFLLDGERVLKLFREGYSRDSVKYEYNNHRCICTLTDNVPQIYELAEHDGRFGYIMQYIRGRSLASDMMNEAGFESAMALFTKLHKGLLESKTDDARSYKEWMLGVLAEKNAPGSLIENIRDLPDGNSLCHGDFHPFNIIITDDGRPYIIDFANICKGPAEYDIARTYMLLNEADTDVPAAEIYLAAMGVSFDSIQRYVEVIGRFRSFELGLS